MPARPGIHAGSSRTKGAVRAIRKALNRRCRQVKIGRRSLDGRETLAVFDPGPRTSTATTVTKVQAVAIVTALGIVGERHPPTATPSDALRGPFRPGWLLSVWGSFNGHRRLVSHDAR